MKPQPGRYGIEGIISRAALYPSYWKTLTRLRADKTQVEVRDDKLHFSQYAFAPASVFPAGSVATEQIAEVDLGRHSQVRLKSGEILFVPPAYKGALVTFVNRHDLPVQRRYSIWSAILDPFLDTWEEQKTIDRQFEWLARTGLDRDRVTAWRREVAVPMIAYNFGASVWEWTLLDLHDALMAQRAHLDRRAFADFYARAMALTALDSVMSDWSTTLTENVSGALHGVLLDWYPRAPIATKLPSDTRSGGDSGLFSALFRWLGIGKKPARVGSKVWDQRYEQIKARVATLVTGLTEAYSQSHRHYHTLTHIEHCLGEARRHWYYAISLNEVTWALIFHDAIYDPQRSDNEARSADWACRVMAELGRPEEEQARVRALILATVHTGQPHTADEALLLDIDLSILGAEEPVFDAYDRAIREEYAFVPEDRYRAGRTAVLKSFLQRDRMFHTAIFHRALEARARANLERALARLGTG